MKYLITIQTRPTQIVKVGIFHIENPILKEFLKIIGAQNHFLFIFNAQ